MNFDPTTWLNDLQSGARQLSENTQNLRDQALSPDGTYRRTVPSFPINDAWTWLGHDQKEDWLLWRARRIANRLCDMPISIGSGERIVGRPELRDPTPEEAEEIAQFQRVHQTIPRFPGGDAGHFHPDYQTLFQKGIRGLLVDIHAKEEASKSAETRTFYRACYTAMRSVSLHADRVADACDEMAEDNPDADWDDLARICRRVSLNTPQTFHEALQLMFIAIIALWFGEDHHLTTPGRMDQTLWPFYQADLDAGRITPEEALDLICGLYIQLNMILGPGSAISVMVGGTDAQGNDVTNDLTYLCLLARAATRLVYPTVGLAWHEGTPPELTDFACHMLTTGIGDPAFFNDTLIINGLQQHGVTPEDAHNYMNSTCVEIKVAGASNMWVTQPYFNCPQALLDVMAEPQQPGTFNALCDRVKIRLAETIQEKAEALDAIWRQRAETGCFPLASCFTRDCLERGLDFDRGGARYNWVENSFVGLANLSDGLLAIKHLVYQEKEMALPEFLNILQNDFEGHEPLRQRILNRLPKYGNDNEEADAIAAEWAQFLSETTATNIVGPHPYVPGFFCWVVHERFGRETGATPDGRKAGFALSDGAGAAQGREKSGPTASVLSTTKWNHQPALGGLVHNVRFASQALKTTEDVQALRNLIETYMRRGGFEIQVNVINADVLKDAQEHPENYADLLVRIAGYSDYFVHLNANMQAEIIARTEHATI